MAPPDPPPRELGDGLVVRGALPADVERVGGLVAHVFRRSPEEPPNPRAVATIRDLASDRHPLSGPDQGLLVEDTRSGAVVAAMWLIPQVWRYDGIAFGVGRPEQVVADPAYRRRGLVRALFEAFHARSAAAGELVQAITGIPYFYRQFGYEFALDLGGSRRVMFADIPKLPAGQAEPYHLRAARRDDLPLIMALYERERRRGPVSADIPEAYWRWMIDGVDRDSGDAWSPLVVVDQGEAARGYIVPRSRRWGSTLAIMDLALADGLPLATAIQPLLRGLRTHALATPLPPGREEVAPDRLEFGLGAAHPVYDALGPELAAHVEPPYAWYVRVPDLGGFLRRIAPALERRLPGTAADGYTGELRLDFYRDGLRLVFAQGRLETVEPWRQPVWRGTGSGGQTAGFPPLVFLQLLFGRRSLDELREAYPDVWAEAEAGAVLQALFPKRPSLVIALD